MENREDENIGYLLKRISDALSARANLAAKGYELTFSQTRVLMCLTKREGGAATQKELERQFGVSHPTMVGVLRRLSDKGFVTTSVGESDRRQREVRLTEKGRGLVGRIRRGITQRESELTAGFADGEKQRLRELLHRIHDNINKEGV